MRISTQLDISEIQTTAHSIEILHENEDQGRDHFSKTDSSSLLQPTCRASPLWLERRSELEGNIVELDAARITTKTLTMQLKLSRCAEDAECSARAVLRNRVKPARHSKRKCLPQSVKTCEQSREIQSSCDFDWKRHTQNLRNPRHCWAKHRLWVVLWKNDSAPMSVN